MQQGKMGYYLGCPVYTSEFAVSTRQYRFPRTKRARVRKKWSKNKKNFKTFPAVVAVGHSIIVHPSLKDRIPE